MLGRDLMGPYQNNAEGYEQAEYGSTLCHDVCGNHTPCQISLVDNTKIRMLQ